MRYLFKIIEMNCLIQNIEDGLFDSDYLYELVDSDYWNELLHSDDWDELIDSGNWDD